MAHPVLSTCLTSRPMRQPRVRQIRSLFLSPSLVPWFGSLARVPVPCVQRPLNRTSSSVLLQILALCFVASLCPPRLPGLRFAFRVPELRRPPPEKTSVQLQTPAGSGGGGGHGGKGRSEERRARRRLGSGQKAHTAYPRVRSSQRRRRSRRQEAGAGECAATSRTQDRAGGGGGGGRGRVGLEEPVGPFESEKKQAGGRGNSSCAQLRGGKKAAIGRLWEGTGGPQAGLPQGRAECGSTDRTTLRVQRYEEMRRAYPRCEMRD